MRLPATSRFFTKTFSCVALFVFVRVRLLIDTQTTSSTNYLNNALSNVGVGNATPSFLNFVPKQPWGKCGEVQTPPTEWKNMLDIFTKDPVRVPKHKIRYNKATGHIGKGKNPRTVFEKQACLYDILKLWNELAQKLGITRWAAHGGSAIAAKCYGAMNPWDDDIDITVHDCKELDTMWGRATANISLVHPNIDPSSHSMYQKQMTWDSRLITDDLILTKGSGICPWYKLITVKEASMWQYGDLISGMDVECTSRATTAREKQPMHQSGYAQHMRSDKKLLTVPFGPTTIQSTDPHVLESYIHLRYGKTSPCQFPFASGVEPEKSLPPLPLDNHASVTNSNFFKWDQEESQMSFALKTWYVPKVQREEWRKQAGNNKQMEFTQQIPNLDTVEIDNSLSQGGCTWGANATVKVIGWNAERGTHWDRFYKLTQQKEELNEPVVILMNEMDVGMARSGNVHTARRLAVQLGMNYAYGVEFVELTPGTKEEQEATKGKRDALSLHGNAILSKCILGDTMILRDHLPHTYFSDKAHRGINADGFEIRLGGRIGLFARIFKQPSPGIPDTHNSTVEGEYRPDDLPRHFVVGNVHKVGETDANRAVLWNYFGFGAPPANLTSKYDGVGVDLAPSQQGVIVQGDFGPTFCSLGGLGKMNNYRIHKTFRAQCLPNGKSKIGPLAGDFFCSNMRVARGVQVTAPCDWSVNATSPLTLADHAIVSIVVSSNKN